MSCAEIAELLAVAPLEDLEGEERPRLEEHLSRCDACRETAAALARAHRHLVEGIDERAAMEFPSPELRERTLAAVRETLSDGAKTKGPGAPDAAPDPAAVEAVGRRIGLACTYCHDRVTRDEVAFCASCLAPHHRECFAAHGHCTVPGCAETRIVRPAEAPEPARPRRRARWLFPLLAAGALAGGVAALTTDDAPERPRRPAMTLPEGVNLKVFREEEEPREETARISIDVADRPLREVVLDLARRSNVPVLVDPTVEENVTIALRDVPPREAVRVIAQLTRCTVEALPGGVLVLAQPPKVTIQFTDANVRTILQLLAAYSGKNVVLAPDVVGTLTVDVEEVHWAIALERIAAAAKLHVTLCGDDIVLVTGRPLAPELRAQLPPLPAWSSAAPPIADPGPRVSVEARDVPLGDLLAQLSSRVGRSLLAAPDVADEKLTLSVRDLALEHLLAALGRLTRCSVRDGAVRVFERPPLVTIQATDCPIRPWLQMLSAAGGTNALIGPDVRGTVTADLKELPYVDALCVTAAAQGFAVQRDEGLVTIIATSAARWLDATPQSTAPSEADVRLTALIVDAGILARAAAAARDDQERARFTAELEAKQAELRALLARSTEPAAARSAPTVTAADGLRRANRAYDRLRSALVERDIAASQSAMTELLGGLDDHARLLPGDDASRAPLNAALADLGDAGRELQRHARLTQAEAALEMTRAALSSADWAAARAGEARANAAAGALRALGDETTAVRVERRAAPLAERLRYGERIGSLKIDVQAVLVAPDLRSAIVNHWILREGDHLPPGDGQAEDAGPKVTGIVRSTVEFVLGGTPFKRELGED